jgi:NAD(P)H dehydrogenase (quinone)
MSGKKKGPTNPVGYGRPPVHSRFRKGQSGNPAGRKRQSEGEHPFFSEWAAESIAMDSTIRLPFGTGRTSPIDVRDVAEVIAAILVSPATHIGKVYELTGPRSQNMHGVAAEYSEALGRPITYVDVPLDQWRDQILRRQNLSDHISEHFLTMARLHAANRYDRLTDDVETIIGRPATNIRDFVAQRREFFERQVAVA